jgi:acetylornithine deacetylase/succinyl-diaminopimelate desuccinylase-like protein
MKTFLIKAVSASVHSVVFLIFALLPMAAQTIPVAEKPDPAIARALRQISAKRIEADINQLVSFQTRATLSAQDPAAIAANRGIGAARDWIKSEFERYSQACGGCLEVKTDTFTVSAAERIPKPTELSNVYAVLKGTDPNEANRIVLVTGHYDSRNSDALDAQGVAPGANDDASGTAVSLECARVLSKLKFPATIIFLTVAGEEQGLYGSGHFAEMAKSSGWNAEAVLNNDIVGGDRSPQQDAGVVRVFSEGVPVTVTDKDLRPIRGLGEESDSASRELARYIVEMGRTYDPGVKPMMIFRPDRFLRGGDQTAFNEEGYAAVRFTEYVARVARLNGAVLAALAAAPAPPANVHLLTKHLENDSTLEWDVAPAGRVPEYEVLERDTTSPDWERVSVVKNGTRLTLPESKDNVIFGVRATDQNGHKSLPVVPAPER